MIDLVAFAALLVIAAPVGRLVADRNFAHVYPRPRLVVAAVLLVWFAIVGAVALWWDWLLAPAALVAAVTLTLATWHSRPRYGRLRRWPPGSLSITRAVRDLARRDALLELAERHGPIFKGAQFSGTVVCMVGLERGQRFVRDHRAAIGPSPLAFNDQIMGGFLRYMDDDTHDRYGPLFRRAMSRSVTDAAEPAARLATRRALGRVTSEPMSPDDELERVAYDTVLHALFGIVADSEIGVAFTASYQQFTATTVLHRRRRHHDALEELRSIVRRHAATLEDATGGEHLAHCALDELRESNPDMPDAVSIDNLLFMLKIGSSNVTSLLRWVLEMYGSEPTWRQRLLAEHRADGSDLQPDLFDAFVMEVLRLAQSEYVYRRLVGDVEFEGFHLRAGWFIRICVWESHRDPRIFDEPATLTDRFHGMRRPASEYCPFGFDRHACNSVSLALMIARTVVAEFAADPAVTVRPSGDLTRSLRQWSHWQPGPSLAVSRRLREPSTGSPTRQVAIEEHLERSDLLAEDLPETAP